MQLNAHETRAIDLRKLRDAQQPDCKNNKIPAAAADGSVTWVRLDNVPVMGRLMVIHRKQGMASNYDCCICNCPVTYVPAADFLSPGSANLLVQGSVGLTLYGSFNNCNYTYFYYNVNEWATWSSQHPNIASVNSLGTVTGQSGGTSSVTGIYTGNLYMSTAGMPVAVCIGSAVSGGPSGPVNVDSLVYTITSGGVATDASGVVSGTPFNLRIQAKTPSGTLPDSSMNAQNVPFTLISKNATVGESAPSSVSFSSGTANASATIVQASGLTSSVRQIVTSAYATGTVFLPHVYMNVTATLEGLVGEKTPCGYVIPQNGQFVTLPYSCCSLCGQQVMVAKGAATQEAPVEDVGPICPNTPGVPPTNTNTCSCTSDPYWLGTGVPKSVALEGTCNYANGSGMDLGNGTASTVGVNGKGGVMWKFP